MSFCLSLIAGLILLAGCGGGGDGGVIPPQGLTLFVDGLNRPTFITHAGDGSGRLFVVEQFGLIRIIADEQLLAEPFLDITDLLSLGGERGLSGLAFHPNFENNGRFYVFFTTERNGRLQDMVSEFTAQPGSNTVDRGTERIILAIDDPHENHNAGMMAFKPGEAGAILYISVGDGGANQGPNGQDNTDLLGNILRIDVDGDDPYAIPQDNPFVSDPDARDEIYAFGFRNPYRWSFDRANGRMFVGDVGQERREEVDIVEAGENYGWDILEGTLHFNPPTGGDTTGLTMPIHEYDHGAAGGCSVIGGYVYRGQDVPSARGKYYFGDFCQGTIWSLTQNGSEWTAAVATESDLRITSFGEDVDGELFVVDINGGIYRFVPG